MSMVLNWYAIVGAGVINMVLGGFWYSPLLFGKQWVKLMGFSKGDIAKMKKKPMGGTFAAGFIASLVMAYVLAHFVTYTQAVGPVMGAITGFWIWLGFIAPVIIGSVLWEGRSTRLYLLNVSYWLVLLLINGAILASF
ncbi:MAG: DUF1761 domain-containing protein [Nanoarchaeota archaeon]|nr:DUF1761 domain-containing protein [Nanoarchaeota archaeon]